MGWVDRRRDHGGVIFLDLRDREGIVQVVFDSDAGEFFNLADSVRSEYVLKVTGKVRARSEATVNPNMGTGEIEVYGTELEILNTAQTPPFQLDEFVTVGEDVRLKYRYMDLRRNEMQNSLRFRSKITSSIRNYLVDAGFLDIETPIMTRATPEGARDYLIPSRTHPGQFFAMPQSPQLFKQMLMVAGFDRYYQIAKCFRDEDLRADRQPEFTQIDCEMSFVNQENILNTFEGLTKHLIKSVKNIDILNFPRITYDEAMEKYGCDKPDIRFGMEFGNLNNVAKHTDFNVFNNSEEIIGIAVPGGSSFTRKEIDKYIEWVKRPQIGASGMIYAKYNDDNTFKSSVDKFFNQVDLAKWGEITGAKKGDIIFVLSGEKNKVRAQLSALRLHVAENLGLRNPNEFAPLWVTDFPLLEWDEDSNKYHAMHHPFTSPKLDQLELLKTNPGEVKANAYDLVLNGNEIGGGSIRIHDKKIQALMLKHLGFSEKDAIEQFGFLMNAFEYGAPPHGGIAFGLDRLVAILGGQESIRDFIAFPKNNSGRDVMINSPSKLDDEQLNELNLKIGS
jgi:aspartyl-tRNA synthetase